MSETGNPEFQTILYAIQRGAYDRHLSQLAFGIKRRRDTMEGVGLIQPSIGDTLELWSEEHPIAEDTELRVPPDLLGARLQVVGFTADKRPRGRLLDTYGKYPRGKILRINPELVYRVHYYA